MGDTATRAPLPDQLSVDGKFDRVSVVGVAVDTIRQWAQHKGYGS